ncbi:unnamed protein product [Dibothriocephalus latus]|uniref:Uncharacterized protein n=1 Tax=Dibothriocephalus latus TaxID=60516 RepID=A0A3P7LU95_DIBLA|nr:unnamed protein product [Dibothriocephalus latus]
MVLKGCSKSFFDTLQRKDSPKSGERQKPGNDEEKSDSPKDKAAQLQHNLPYITMAVVATELLLVLFMLCCKPAKKKEKKDDDNDDDVADNGNGGGKGNGNGGDKTGGNGAPGTMVVDMSKPIQINLNIPGLSGEGGKTGGPFRMLHATTPSNVYGSSN